MEYAEHIKDKKVLLLGGAGFIGHNLALKLLQNGASVTIADSFNINNILNLQLDTSSVQDASIYNSFLDERLSLLKQAGAHFKINNVSDRYQLSSILQHDYDVVYLLAAVSHASRSNSFPVNALENGLVPLTNVVMELSERSDTRLVYLSSSTVYGHFTKLSVDEQDICNPFGMYAVLKHTGERLLQTTAEYSNLNFSVVRPSALYGERCISRRVSQIFLENAFAGRELIINGSTHEKLDFTYIDDLLSGLILAGIHEDARGEVFNITYGDAKPVMDLVEILKRYFPNLRYSVTDRNQATPIRGTLSNQKAKTILGFRPEWTLQDGYAKYIEWYINRSKSYEMIFNTISQTNE